MSGLTLLAIEGASGTGKTTVAGLLGNRLGWVHTSTPPDPLRALREKLEGECTPLFSMLFNLLGVKRCSDLWQTQSVSTIVDRYYFSTFIYSGLVVDSDLVKSYLGLFEIAQPTNIVILQSKESVRERRIVERATGSNENSEFRRRVNSINCEIFARRFGEIFPEQPILCDTTNLSCSEVADEIIKQLGL